MARPTTDRTARRLRVAAGVLAPFALTLALAAGANAATPVPLGTAGSFALLAGSGISNTGSTTITGDIGLCCSTNSITGFGTVTQPAGTVYNNDPAGVSLTAQNDLDIAYDNAFSQPVTSTGGVDLSLRGTPANPLLPGVYQSTGRGALSITGGLYLDFQNDPNAVFVFQGDTLTTAAGAAGSVFIVNGGSAPSACNIFWQLASTATGVSLGTNSAFKGTTLALGASTLGTGATVDGRILTRRSKAVTLDTNTITRSACSTPPSGGGGGGSPTQTDSTPTPVSTPAPEAETAVAEAPPAASPVVVTAAPKGPSGPGVAEISGPSAPVRGPFTVTVTGKAIAKVTFYVDGRPVGVVNARPGRRKFKKVITPRGTDTRVHRITAKVTFTTPRTRTTTLRLTFRRTPPKPRSPRFTG